MGLGEDEKAVRSRPESSYAASHDELDDRLVKKTLRKIDIHLVPFLMLLYVFSFLDRGMF